MHYVPANMAWTERICRGRQKTNWSLHETKTFPAVKTFLLEDTYSKGSRMRIVLTKNHSTWSWPVFTGKNTGFSIIRDEDFANANEAKALDAEVKFLKKSEKGKKPNAAQPLSAEMIIEILREKVLGKHNGEALTNTNFLNISQHFGFRGRQEHHQLKLCDFKIVSISAGKYIEWSVERLRKISANKRKFNTKMWATNHEESLKNTSPTDQVLCV